MHVPIDDAELMRLISQGDPGALENLYDRYEKTVYAFAYRMVGDAMLAEEVVQELFMRIWHHGERYDPRLSKLSTWIFSVTRNIAIDQLRRKHNRTTHQTSEQVQFERIVDSGATPEEIYAEKWVNQQVQEAIHDLHEDQQQVLDLIYYQGYTHKEVSERHGIPLGTVKSRIRLAMKQLKSRLQSLERRITPHDTTASK